MAPPAHIAAPGDGDDERVRERRDGVLDVGSDRPAATRDGRDAREPREPRAPRDTRGTTDARAPREAREQRRERRSRRFTEEGEDDPPPAQPTADAPQPVVYEEVLDLARVDADAARVIRRLREQGFEAYLVGGGVRDLLLGRTPKDFDIATSARPQDVKRVFRNSRIIGRRFRLAHILFPEGKVIECATFRRDPDQELGVLPPDVSGARPHRAEGAVRLVPLRSVTDTDDLLIRQDNHFGLPHEDASRRDFTVNGLFFDPRKNTVIDYVGGMADVDRRVVRTIGDPAVRFREDPIRILRAIKFSARLDMGLAPEVYDAICEHRDDLSRAAKPRIFEEILRLLRGGAAMRSMYLAWDLGVLAVILPELSAFLDDGERGASRTFARLAAVDARSARGEVPQDSVLLTALFFDAITEALDGEDDLFEAFSDAFGELERRVALPRKAKERMIGLYISLARLRKGKVGAVASSGLFDEAKLLFLLEHDVDGLAPPDWALGRAPVPLEDEASRKKRRRRKKPAG